MSSPLHDRSKGTMPEGFVISTESRRIVNMKKTLASRLDSLVIASRKGWNWRSTCSSICVCLVSLVLAGCGSSISAPNPSPSPLAVSRISTGGRFAFETLTVSKSQLTGPSTHGLDFAWRVTASSVPMHFTVASTVPWLTFSSTFGTLEPNGSTDIGLLSLDATSLPNARNTGGFTVSALGYQDNTFIGVEVNCGLTDSHGNPACEVTLSNDLSFHPLP